MTCYRGQRKKENAKPMADTVLPHQVHHGLQVIRLRKQIHQMHLCHAIPRSQQCDEVARQRCRITRNVNNAWRAQVRQLPRHAFSQATSRRVDHRKVGRMSALGEEFALPDSPALFCTGQVLLRRGLNRFSIRRQIVSKIACGSL